MTAYIGIHSPPRCGSTWVGEMFNADSQIRYGYQPFHAHNDKHEEFTGEDRIREHIQSMVTANSRMVHKKHARTVGLLPETKRKSSWGAHMAYKETRFHNLLPQYMRRFRGMRLVLLIRDPRDCILSWQKAMRYQHPFGDEIANDWLDCKGLNDVPSEFNGYAGWRRAVEIFNQLAKDYDNRVRIYKYEDICADPIKFISDARSQIGLSANQEVDDFIAASSQSNHNSVSPFSVYRDNITLNPWKTELDPEIAQYITDDLKGQFMIDNNLHYA